MSRRAGFHRWIAVLIEKRRGRLVVFEQCQVCGDLVVDRTTRPRRFPPCRTTIAPEAPERRAYIARLLERCHAAGTAHGVPLPPEPCT